MKRCALTGALQPAPATVTTRPNRRIAEPRAFRLRMILASRRLPLRQEIAHALKRLQDVLGRVGVGQPQIAFAEDAEVRPADGDDSGLVEQRVRQLLRLP